MGKKILGLDIQNDALAAVLINSGLKGNSIEGHAYIPFGGSPGDDALSAAMDRLMEQMDTTGSVCVAAIPADRVSFRNIQVPFKQAKKIKQILPFELEPTLPFSVDSQIIDFQALKNESGSEQTDLITAAVDISHLQSYLDLLSAYQLDPQVVTISGYPAALCLARLAEIPEQTMVISVGRQKSALYFISAGQLCLVRSIPSGSLASDRVKTISQNILRTLSAFEASAQQPYRADKVFITGMAAGENGCTETIGRTVNAPVEKTNLVEDTAGRLNNRPDRTWNPDQMDNALALALIESIGIKGINFRKGPFAIKKRWAEHKKSIIRSAVLAGVLLVCVLANIVIDYHFKTARLEELNNRINGLFTSTFPDVQRIVDPLQQMKAKIDEARRTSLSSTGGENDLFMVDILNELSRRIPKEIDVRFSRMVIGGDDSVVITGDTDTFNTVDTMKGRLEEADAFKEVTIVSTTKDKDGTRIRFRIKIRI
jgi:type II secretion system protein L